MPAPSPINFTRGVPANESFPSDELVECATAVLRRRARAFFNTALGGPRATARVAGGMAGREAGSSPDGQRLASAHRVSVPAMHSARRCRVHRVPTYDRTITLLRRHGADVVGIPLQPDGPDIGALERALKQQDQILLRDPGLPESLRGDVLWQRSAGRSSRWRRSTTCCCSKTRLPHAALSRHGGTDAALTGAGAHPAHDSFTKLIAPGVRIGFMPGRADTWPRSRKLPRTPTSPPGYLAHGVVYEWCRRGLLMPQIEQLKALYAPRLDACLDALDQYMPTAEPRGRTVASSSR